MADFSIDGFRGVLAKQGGLAPSNKYRVELPPLNELKRQIVQLKKMNMCHHST